jgi:hypothetical protein
MKTVYLTSKILLRFFKVGPTVVAKLMAEGSPHIKLDRGVLFRKVGVAG